MMKPPANSTCWAIGQQRRNGFHVRRVVWGLLMAQAERRKGEEVRAATIMVEGKFKRRANVAKLPPLPVPDFSDKLGRD